MINSYGVMMIKDRNIWVIHEERIDDLLAKKNISIDEVSELFKIGHSYNMERKLIPQRLSDWMKNQSEHYRSKSSSLYKILGINIPSSRPTDAYTMSMVVSDVWGEIFNEKPIVDIFNNIAKKYDVKSEVIMQNFMKHWSTGLDYHLVLRMRELSPFEMGLVATYVSPIIKNNKSDKMN